MKKAAMPTMKASSMTPEQRQNHRIANLKCHKPSIMAENFRAYYKAQAAQKRGEEYKYIPPSIFLILDEGGPFSIQTAEEIIDEWGKWQSERSGEETDSEPMANIDGKGLLHPESAYLLRYGQSTYVKGDEVHGVVLEHGGARNWWNELTKRLQPEDGRWSDTMEWYVEYLQPGVECGGNKMEAFRVKRHFPEDVGENAAKGTSGDGKKA